MEKIKVDVLCHGNINEFLFVVPKNIGKECRINFYGVPGLKYSWSKNTISEEISRKVISETVHLSEHINITCKTDDVIFDTVLEFDNNSFIKINDKEINKKLIKKILYNSKSSNLSLFCYRLNLLFPGKEWVINLHSCLEYKNSNTYSFEKWFKVEVKPKEYSPILEKIESIELIDKIKKFSEENNKIYVSKTIENSYSKNQIDRISREIYCKSIQNLIKPLSYYIKLMKDNEKLSKTDDGKSKDHKNCKEVYDKIINYLKISCSYDVLVIHTSTMIFLISEKTKYGSCYLCSVFSDNYFNKEYESAQKNYKEFNKIKWNF